MPWLALLTDLRVWLAAALIATGIYAKVQTVRLEQEKAEFAQFRADVESEAAKSKVAAAREALRHAENTTEVISGLQIDNASLRARYDRVRASAASRPVPAISCPAAGPGPGTGNAPESDPPPRCLAVMEAGELEIAKYKRLWELQLRNSGSAL